MDDVSGTDSPARLNGEGEHGAEDKNKGMIINTDAGNCQTFSWHFRASLAQAGKLCYFPFFMRKFPCPPPLSAASARREFV
jgi:hypothetical protein